MADHKIRFLRQTSSMTQDHFQPLSYSIATHERPSTIVNRSSSHVTPVKVAPASKVEDGVHSVPIKPAWGLGGMLGNAWHGVLIGIGLMSSIAAYSSHLANLVNLAEAAVPSLLCSHSSRIDLFGLCPLPQVENWANFSVGARHLEHLSSSPKQVASLIRYTQSSLFIHPSKAQEPSVVIDSSPPNLISGNCWPMDGSYGFYGVSLPRPVFITNVTVSHILSTSSDQFATTPRDMDLWAVVKTADLGDITDYFLRSTWMFTRSDLRDLLLPRLEPGHELVPVTRMLYDKNSGQITQSFSPRYAYVWRHVKVDTVVLEIKSNWGSTAKTCLYNLQIFGHT